MSASTIGNLCRLCDGPLGAGDNEATHATKDECVKVLRERVAKGDRLRDGVKKLSQQRLGPLLFGDSTTELDYTQLKLLQLLAES